MRPNHHQSRTDTAVQSPAAPQHCPTAHLSHSQTVEACSNTAILNVNGGNTSWKRILKYLHVASAPPQQAEILPLLRRTYPFQLTTFNLNWNYDFVLVFVVPFLYGFGAFSSSSRLWCVWLSNGQTIVITYTRVAHSYTHTHPMYYN